MRGHVVYILNMKRMVMMHSASFDRNIVSTVKYTIIILLAQIWII